MKFSFVLHISLIIILYTNILVHKTAKNLFEHFKLFHNNTIRFSILLDLLSSYFRYILFL